MVTLTIDGQKMEAAEGTTLLQVARLNGIEIPTLCHHDALTPYGACRLCTVEVGRGKKSRLATACTHPAEDGLVVQTHSPQVVAARKMIMELLLARCPNVPIIKDMAREMGIVAPRFKLGDDNCILCGLCERVCDEVVGARAISFINRGIDREIATPFKIASEECIGCGACAAVCPTGAITVEGEAVEKALLLGPNKAIHVPFLQAVPNVPIIDRESCIHFKTGGCGVCEKYCEVNAINHEMEPETLDLDIGTIIVATGHQFYNAGQLPQFNYGYLPNVIDSVQFERMCSAAGPTGGEIRLEDGRVPQSVAMLHCVGSRDHNANSYCSRLCCMHAMKQAHLIKEKTGADVYELYIDIRAAGKGYEEFYERVQREGVIFIRGRGAEVMKRGNVLVVKAEETGLGRPIELGVDMVVLVTGMVPQEDAGEMAKILHVTRDKDGFFLEAHPKLRPFNTNTDGIFLAGTCQGPKDIPDTVAHANAAAAEVLALLGHGKVTIEPTIATIEAEYCAGCKTCIDLCAYSAITFDEEKKISEVNTTLCKGCGVCVSACPSGAAVAKHFTDEQIFAEIEGLLSDEVEPTKV
jgi:heterodisulfide reductase subunit A2